MDSISRNQILIEITFRSKTTCCWKLNLHSSARIIPCWSRVLEISGSDATDWIGAMTWSAFFLIKNAFQHQNSRKDYNQFTCWKTTMVENFWFFYKKLTNDYKIKVWLTHVGKVTNYLSTSICLKMAERSEAKCAKRSFASKYLKFWFLTRSFASRFLASLRPAILSEI